MEKPQTLEDILEEIAGELCPPRVKPWIAWMKGRIEEAMQRQGWYQAVPFEGVK